MRRNQGWRGFHSKLVAVAATLAMLGVSVAAGTALAVEGEPADTTQTQMMQGDQQQTPDDGTAVETQNVEQEDENADTTGTVGDGDVTNTGGTEANDEATTPEDESIDDGAEVGDPEDNSDNIEQQSDTGTGNAEPAASNRANDANVSTRAYSDHTVQGLSPRGTTIDLFDYWASQDQDNNDFYYNQGINGNNHQLKFNTGKAQSATDVINAWTGSGQPPLQNIVENTLGEDGYPVIKEGQITGTFEWGNEKNYSGTQSLKKESLGYLFNHNSVDGKQGYYNVGGLLQVDSKGYYYYNASSKAQQEGNFDSANFASFNEDTNSFTLYDTWAVMKTGTRSPDGQFFPFNTADQVFGEWDGNLYPSSIKSENGDLNHYFGMHMSTRFVQQNDGYTDKNHNTPVTYEFSGDDDVWIYIDNVLVGDLGGIHDAAKITIDFSSGMIKIIPSSGSEDDAITSTLKEAFMDALGDGAAAAFTDKNTFKNNTYHTLDFFYLERGNNDSNMSLKFNLVNIPESGVLKVDQAGAPLPNVSFTLQQADDNYNIQSSGRSFTGQTDENGEMIFTEKNVSGEDIPITLEQLREIAQNWVLTENEVPDGYRSAGPMHLRFQDGVLLSSNEWTTGAWSQPNVTVTAPATVYKEANHQESHDVQQNKSTLFAVVFKKKNDEWYPVSGDAFKGWSVAKTNDNQDIVTAAKANQYQFVLGSGGGFEVTIDDLPGDISTYKYVIEQNTENITEDAAEAKAQYTVRYFWADVPTIADITADNIVEVDPHGNGKDTTSSFDRMFSVTLNVPNIKNELKLKKTDEDGTSLSGAVFTLHEAVWDDDQSAYVKKTGGNSYVQQSTQDGVVSITTSGSILADGTYVLEETTPPKGYAANGTLIPIVVDDTGVHVYAGSADDNVSVETGIGSLVYSMKGFAANDDVDATLHDVHAIPQIGTDGNWDDIQWPDSPDSDESSSAIHYQYDDKSQNLSYKVQGNDTNDGTYRATEGWSRLDVMQCYSHSGTVSTYKENLGNQSLNALFTGDVTVVVANHPLQAEASFVIRKVLDGRGWKDDDSFTFTVAADDDNSVLVDGTTTTTAAAVKNGYVVLPNSSVTIDSDTDLNPDTEGADHAVRYGGIVFRKTGTYKFTVAEEKGSIPNIAYSTERYTVTITVGDLAGSPTVSIVDEDDASAQPQEAVFTNRFVSVSSLPLTGGVLTPRSFVVVGVVVLLLAGGAWLLARRRLV